jgi:pimeloyl-ACP methyl ester carboxylesterase
VSGFEPTEFRMVQGRAGVATWEVGEGAPVLCIHGFPDHAISLRPLAEELAEAGYRAICPALPGYWPSEPVGHGDYSVASVAEDMLAVLDAMNIDSVAVVGHDWGAEIAYYLGAHHPERLSSLIALSAPHPAGFATRRTAFSEQATAWYAIFLAYSPAAPMVASQPHWLTALVQSWSPGFFWSEWPSILALIARTDVMTAVCSYYHDDMVHELELAPVRVPATVIHGGQDGALRPVLFTSLDSWFEAGLTKHLLPELGHWPHLEDPAAVTALILEALHRSQAQVGTRAAKGD